MPQTSAISREKASGEGASEEWANKVAGIVWWLDVAILCRILSGATHAQSPGHGHYYYSQ